MTKHHAVARYFRVGLIVALLAFVSFPNTVNAADPTFRDSITMSPTSIRVSVDPGDKLSKKLKIINDGQTDYDFVVYARPYWVNDENYSPDFTKQLSNTDAYSWVQFDTVNYHLNPGESVDIPFDIVVPAKVSPGGHYGVIFAETQPKTDGTSSIARKKRVGALLYATVSGDYDMKGGLSSVTIAPLQFRSPLTASVTVKNEGNADFIAKTTLRVSDFLGRVKYETTTEHVILPDTTRRIDMEWKDSPWFGIYKVDIVSSMLDQQATQNGGYVLLAPRWLLIFVGLLVIGGIGYAILRRRKH